MPRVGLQLWTLRDACDRDLASTLARVGALGYDGVELFSLHGHDAASVRSLLDGAGLSAAGRHASLDLLEGSLDQVAEEADVLGSDRVAVNWIEPETLGHAAAVRDRIEAAAHAAARAGLRLGFHNHWSEVAPLEDGRTFLDLLRDLPAELLWLELDLGWTWHAGADPRRELEASAGRCPLVHLKDYRSRVERDDVPVGDGAVGYDRVIPAAVGAGAEWLVVEEDDPGPSPFEAVERSLVFVRGALAA